MKKFTHKILLTFLLCTFYFALSTGVAFASDISFELNKKEINRGEEFVLNVEINTTESVNAVEGRVHFDSRMLELRAVREGGSVINFWVEKPYLEKEGSIFFSGITPGGFSGKNNIFSLVFVGKSVGSASFSFADLKILKNDGQGTKLDIAPNNIIFSIKEGDGESKKEELKDNELPEVFKPELGVDEAIFEGQNFIVFSTVDKISGIDHYEVREGWIGSYKEALSPHLLEHQKLNKKIYIKAVDRAGNERVVSFYPIEREWYENYYLFAIIILLAMVFIYRKKLWQKFIK